MSQQPPGARPPRPDEPPPEPDDAPAAAALCRRCRKRIARKTEGAYFQTSGLCFWCAYIDSQG